MKKRGFTLAEVLLTLAVIGIVAAITLPALLVDTTEKAFDAQKKALHARLAQAIGMMDSLSGYGTDASDAAQTFIYDGLSKVYKMNNICEADKISDCNLPATITTMNDDLFNSTGAFPTTLFELNPDMQITGQTTESDGTTSDDPNFDSSDKLTTDTKAAAFETVNGESVVVFYNASCKGDRGSGTQVKTDQVNGGDVNKEYYYAPSRMCVNFVYDVNGKKGPNKVGKDIGFITALYARNSEVVGPVPFSTDTTAANSSDAAEECTSLSDGGKLPNKAELASLYYNKNLINNLVGGEYWSSTVESANIGWYLDTSDGTIGKQNRSTSLNVRCLRK